MTTRWVQQSQVSWDGATREVLQSTPLALMVTTVMSRATRWVQQSTMSHRLYVLDVSDHSEIPLGSGFSLGSV